LSTQQSIAAGSEVTVSLPKTIQRARLTCTLLDADSKQNRDVSLPALSCGAFRGKKILKKKLAIHRASDKTREIIKKKKC